MPEKLRPVIQVYCDSLAEQIGALERMVRVTEDDGALSQETWRLLRETAHRMAGTAQSIGFDEFGALIGELESTAHALAMAPQSMRMKARDQVCEIIARIRVQGNNLRPDHSRLWVDTAGAVARDMVGGGAFAETVLAEATVLVADDDRTVLQLVRTALVDAGAKRTILASDGRDALDQSYPKQPTVVIADWRMAPMNGLDLLSEIRNGRTHMRADTPFVLLTRINDREALRTAIRAGVDYFLVKPFTREALLRAIKIAKERHAQARAGFQQQDVLQMKAPDPDYANR